MANAKTNPRHASLLTKALHALHMRRHQWDGCTCTVCGKTQDSQHDWNGCTCKKCGSVRDEHHDWDRCVCKTCRAKKDAFENEHEWYANTYTDSWWNEECGQWEYEYGCVFFECRHCGQRVDGAGNPWYRPECDISLHGKCTEAEPVVPPFQQTARMDARQKGQ